MYSTNWPFRKTFKMVFGSKVIAASTPAEEAELKVDIKSEKEEEEEEFEPSDDCFCICFCEDSDDDKQQNGDNNNESGKGFEKPNNDKALKGENTRAEREKEHGNQDKCEAQKKVKNSNENQKDKEDGKKEGKAEDPPPFVDPQEVLRESCGQKKECTSLKEKLEECNARVESKSKTSETCVQEIIDFMHCVDHCVAKTLFSKLK